MGLCSSVIDGVVDLVDGTVVPLVLEDRSVVLQIKLESTDLRGRADLHRDRDLLADLTAATRDRHGRLVSRHHRRHKPGRQADEHADRQQDSRHCSS